MAELTARLGAHPGRAVRVPGPGGAGRLGATAAPAGGDGPAVEVEARWRVARERLELGAEVGRGAGGVTFRGRLDARGGGAGEEVAVKRVAWKAGGPACLAREVAVLTAVSSPHVVRFLGLCAEPGGAEGLVLFLIFELLEGGDLKAALPTLGPRQAAQALLDVALGLRALHGLPGGPVVHRDVKPSNVLLDGRGRAKLADFGLARFVPAGSEALTGETGTYVYMAPEVVLREEHYDERCDVYGWAILAAEVWTSETPYGEHFLSPTQTALAAAREERPLRPRLPPDMPPELRALVEAAWDPDPARRPSSAELCDALPAACRGEDGWEPTP